MSHDELVQQALDAFGDFHEALREAMKDPSNAAHAAHRSARWAEFQDRLAKVTEVENLTEAIRHMHGAEATYVETAPIVEAFQGATVWEGDVKVFDLVGHAGGARHAYAWSYPTTGGKRQFVAVLGLGPVTGPREAVQATIMAEAQKRR